MSWTDSYTASPTLPNRHSRPTRSTYLPTHLRHTTPNPNGSFHDNPGPFGFTSDSSGYRNPSSRGGGGRSGGRGRGWGGRSWASPSHIQTPNPNPFDVFEKFDELEVIEDTDVENGINFDAYEDIPVEASGLDIPPPANSFADINLGKALNDNIERCKYVKPTPIQRHAIPVAMAGRDLMACAQTGSGKTAAFCFPIISGILRQNLSPVPSSQMRVAYPLALILSPTRELSCQLHNLEKGVDILVATPGRLVDMIERVKISLKRIS